MLKVTLTVTIHLRAPLLTKDSSAGRLGVDAPMARTHAADGGDHYVLPFSLVRGRVRDALRDLAARSTKRKALFFVDDLFGPEPRPNEAPDPLDPVRGRVCFSDFLGPIVPGVRDTLLSDGQVALAGGDEGDNPEWPTMTRIRHDPFLDAAVTGALQVIERPFKAGETVLFKGDIHFIAKEKSDADGVVWQLKRGLAWLARIGADVGVGFGQVTAVTIDEEKQTELPKPAAITSQETTLDLTIQVYDPLCIAKRRIADNLFESSDAIPGNVIKGAVATTLMQGFGLVGKVDGNQPGNVPPEWMPLLRNFERIGFSFAFPCEMEDGDTAHRPTVKPLSLVQDRAGTVLKDVALCDRPIVLKDEKGACSASAFDIDWKSFALAEAEFPWPKVRRELRVRTAIDADARRAKDEALFAYEMVLPHGLAWRARVHLDQVPDGDRPAVRGALEALFAFGLGNLGKSKARWHGGLTAAKQSAPRAALGGGLWVLTLQTPALLLDPTGLKESSGEKELHEAYRTTFADISGQKLTLGRFFARQSLAGGYVVGRFQRGKPYNPFILTDAGSVFVLQENGSSAAALIEHWQIHGLDLPTGVRAAYGDTWQSNPYLPCHGFGEVAVNLACHKDLQPKKGEFDVIA